jgi:hypothetical protein
MAFVTLLFTGCPKPYPDSTTNPHITTTPRDPADYEVSSKITLLPRYPSKQLIIPDSSSIVLKRGEIEGFRLTTDEVPPYNIDITYDSRFKEDYRLIIIVYIGNKTETQSSTLSNVLKKQKDNSHVIYVYKEFEPPHGDSKPPDLICEEGSIIVRSGTTYKCKDNKWVEHCVCMNGQIKEESDFVYLCKDCRWHGVDRIEPPDTIDGGGSQQNGDNGGGGGSPQINKPF